MEIKKENYFIDNVKVLLIFLVVFGHLIERYIDTNKTLMGIYIFIYTFHMPLFIYISGYLSKNVNKSKKIFFKGLFIPYLVFNIIWYLLAYIYTKEIHIPIIYPGWTLWFLLSLFFWRISLKYLIKVKYIIPISFILGLLVGIMSNGEILAFSRTIVFLPFFLIGYYSDFSKMKNIIDKIDYKIAILGLILFFIFSLILTEKNLIDYRFLYGSYAYQDVGLDVFRGLGYRTILYMSSIILSILICKITPKIKTFYTNMGKSTMYIYVFHIYIVLAIFYFLPNWNSNIITNAIIIISPLFITYILSLSLFEKMYNLLFNPIYKLIK